jgi:hypothetical protein
MNTDLCLSSYDMQDVALRIISFYIDKYVRAIKVFTLSHQVSTVKTLWPLQKKYINPCLVKCCFIFFYDTHKQLSNRKYISENRTACSRDCRNSCEMSFFFSRLPRIRNTFCVLYRVVEIERFKWMVFFYLHYFKINWCFTKHHMSIVFSKYYIYIRDDAIDHFVVIR